MKKLMLLTVILAALAVLPATSSQAQPYYYGYHHGWQHPRPYWGWHHWGWQHRPWWGWHHRWHRW